MKSKKHLAKSTTDIVIIAILLVTCFVMLYPFLYCLAYSLSNSGIAMTRIITIFPVGFTLENYTIVLKSDQIILASLVTVARTVAGVVFGVVVTGLASYAISKKEMPGNRAIAFFLIIPMYVGGGLLPYYVIIHDLHLFNNFLVYILPNGFWAFHMLIMRSYFETLPQSLEESVRLDGAGDMTAFLKIVLPLSMPIIATIAIFLGVAQWNSWFDAMLFITKQKMYPLQMILQKMLLQMDTADLREKAMSAGRSVTSSESMRMSTLMVTTVPIIIIYPFFQKYFVKGVMIGAVKA